MRRLRHLPRYLRTEAHEQLSRDIIPKRRFPRLRWRRVSARRPRVRWNTLRILLRGCKEGRKQTKKNGEPARTFHGGLQRVSLGREMCGSIFRPAMLTIKALSGSDDVRARRTAKMRQQQSFEEGNPEPEI